MPGGLGSGTRIRAEAHNFVSGPAACMVGRNPGSLPPPWRTGVRRLVVPVRRTAPEEVEAGRHELWFSLEPLPGTREDRLAS